jgi:hypothetical protein
MIAPCGIEIKVGQVWKGLLFAWTVQGLSDFGSVTLVRNSLCSGPVFKFTYSSQFTNKRGGYKIIRGQEQK